MKLLKNCTKETSVLPAIQKTNILQSLPDTEIHGVQELPAVFFDNAQNTLKKLVWK